jgi:hypothetical protein
MSLTLEKKPPGLDIVKHMRVARVSADLGAYNGLIEEIKLALLALPPAPRNRKTTARSTLRRKLVGAQNVVKSLEWLHWALTHDEEGDEP